MFFCCCGCQVEYGAVWTGSGTDLGAEWQEVTGDWTKSGGSVTTLDTNAILIHTQTYEKLAEGFSFIVRPNIFSPFFEPDYTQKSRVYWGYVDADNCYFLEITTQAFMFGGFATPLMVVNRRVGGVNTVLSRAEFMRFGFGVAPYPTHVQVCFQDGLCTVGVYAESGCGGLTGWCSEAYMVFDYSTESPPKKFGLGTGDAIRPPAAGAGWNPNFFQLSNVVTAEQSPTTVGGGFSCICIKNCAEGCPDGAPHYETYTVTLTSFTCGTGGGLRTVGGTYFLPGRKVWTESNELLPSHYYPCWWGYHSPDMLEPMISLVKGNDHVWTLVFQLRALCIPGGGVQGINTYTYKSEPQVNCKISAPLVLTKTSEVLTCSCSVAAPLTMLLSRIP